MRTPGAIEQTAWAVNPCSWRDATSLSTTLGIPLVAAMVMAGRGLGDPASARQFLDCSFPLPDPFLFQGMPGAVEVISAAIDQGRKIVVHGDYDADGITATALLLLALRELGADVDWYLPSRFEEGYGLSRQAVEAIVARGAGVLITVDCGVNYPDEVSFAKDLGLEVVVVDHHQPGPRLPDCHLVHQVKGEYPHGDLCGVGLALKVMHALHIQRLDAAKHTLPERLAGSLDLVAIGTIADLANLQGENRYYVREGLKLIALGQRVGLRALAEVSGCAGAVDSGAVAFRLAPRLNAAGRLADPSPPLRLLLTEDEEEARSLASELHELNGARQDLERKMFDQAVKQVSALASLPTALVLAADGWHEGVVGIVASRMVERYHRPTVLLGIREGVAKGSGRSIPAYDLLGGLNSCTRLLSLYGGHAQAAGLTMDAHSVGDFREALQKHAASALAPADLVPTFCADAVIRSEELNVDTAQALGSLEPFGTGNPRPRLLVVDAVLDDAETTRNGLHLRCRVRAGGVKLSAIGFGMGQRSDIIGGGPETRLVGAQLRVDEWQGSLRPQLVLESVGSGGGVSADFEDCSLDCPHRGEEWLTGSAAEIPSEKPANEQQVSRLWPGVSRDLRNRPGRLSALAQVLATQERTVVLTCCAAHTVAEMRSRLPLGLFGGGGFVCVSRLCAQTAAARIASARLSVVEWEAAAEVTEALTAYTHAIALDPPFRKSHQQLMLDAGDQGAAVHLLYGDEQRTETARLLRYLLHPRFAMVCLYRAMGEADSDPSRVFSRASALAWKEAGVVLTGSDLSRAQGILAELGLEQAAPGKAKLDARDNAAYREVEADYEECVRLCLTL